MTDKNPAAVELGRLGGSAKSERKTLAVRANAKRSWATRRQPDPLLNLLHAAVRAEAMYRLALRETSRRDSLTVRARWWATGSLPY